METCWMNRVVLVMREGKGDVEFELATARSLTAIHLLPFFLPTISWHRRPLIL